MSQENVDWLRAFESAFNDRDRVAMEGLLAPDAEWRPALAPMLTQPVYRGADEVCRLLLEEIPSLLEDFRAEVLQIHETEADTLLIEVRFAGRGSGSRVPVEQVVFQVYRFRDGKARSLHSYVDEEEALEATGRSEFAIRAELVRRGIQAINDRDLDGLLAVMDDEVEAVPLLAAMEGRYHGHDGIRRWWANLLDTFPDFGVEVLELREIGEVIVAVLDSSGRGVGSDTPIDARIWHVSRFRRYKCIGWRVYTSESEAFEAEGLSE